jgi:diaphanous 2
MILKVDEHLLGPDAFLSMKGLAPQANEMELCRAYKGSVEDLDVASRWVKELEKIPAFSARFDCLVFVRGFEEEFGRLKKIVDAYKGFCDFLVDSDEMKKLLRVLLDAGNIVNSGTRRGDAFGFRVGIFFLLFGCLCWYG